MTECDHSPEYLIPHTYNVINTQTAQGDLIGLVNVMCVNCGTIISKNELEEL